MNPCVWFLTITLSKIHSKQQHEVIGQVANRLASWTAVDEVADDDRTAIRDMQAFLSSTETKDHLTIYLANSHHHV